MRSRLYKYLPGILIALGILLALHTQAQDTISTEGIDFSPAAPVVRKDTVIATVNTLPAKTGNNQTLWGIFGAGFLGGLAALLMPCIFPMLPLTVSYFTKKARSRQQTIKMATLYGLSIMCIYVVLGLLITIAFGADALNSLATNGIFNIFFFLLLIIFAASFLGAFEITLPNAWVNKMDQNSGRSGLAGIFFMAATLSLVSFSCTGPIIGTLLVQAAVSGAVLGPAIGMLGFSVALAIPFALFAMFPSLMQGLPRSGSWLNSVKVTLGFLELALALKFLSNVDLAYHWQWFDREVFLVLWIVIFGLMGIYLLGKLRLNHDSDLQYLSVPRLFTAILVMSFTLYMIPGLWGAPLKSISAFLPPSHTQDFDLYTPTLSGLGAENNFSMPVQQVKYAGKFHAPLGLNAFFDYREGIAYAKKMHKPVMIDFTGHACVNCRQMESVIWPHPDVLPLIRDKYVLIQLYVDDKTDLPANEQYYSSFSGKKIRTIGALNSDIQASKYNSNAQPFYVLLNPDTETLLINPLGANFDPQAYSDYLKKGLGAYQSAGIK